MIDRVQYSVSVILIIFTRIQQMDIPMMSIYYLDIKLSNIEHPLPQRYSNPMTIKENAFVVHVTLGLASKGCVSGHS